MADLPTPEHYDLLAAWAFHTYALEAAECSPFIWFYAVAERGKSRVGKAMTHVAWRGLHVESVKEAYLIRMAAHFQATIFFDVQELSKKAESAGSTDTLLTRFEKGIKVGKVMYPDRGPHLDIEYFETFGATIAATNMPVHEILETRCIQINMPESSRSFDSVVKPSSGLPFKERLLAFRARHLMGSLPEVQKPAKGRLGDILRPLRQIIHFVKPDRELNFVSFVQGLEAERRQQKASSAEAQIVTAVIALERSVAHGKLAIKAITDKFNEGRAENQKWTYQYMGRKLDSLGFQKASMPDSNRAILWEEGLLVRVAERYGAKAPGRAASSSSPPGVETRNTGDQGVTGDPGVSNPPPFPPLAPVRATPTDPMVSARQMAFAPSCFGASRAFVPYEQRRDGIGDKCTVCPYEHDCSKLAGKAKEATHCDKLPLPTEEEQTLAVASAKASGPSDSKSG